MKRVLLCVLTALVVGLTGVVQANTIVFYKGNLKLKGEEAAGKINKKFDVYGIREVTTESDEDPEVLILVFVCKDTMTYLDDDIGVLPTSDGTKPFDWPVLESIVFCSTGPLLVTRAYSNQVSPATFELVKLDPNAEGPDGTLAKQLAFEGYFSKAPGGDDDASPAEIFSDSGVGAAKGKIRINKKLTKAFQDYLKEVEVHAAPSFLGLAYDLLVTYLEDEGYSEAECILAP